MIWPFKRKKWEQIGNAWQSSAVEAQLETLLSPDNIFLADRDLRAVPYTEFEKIIFDCWFPKDIPEYASEIFDCDNFAIAFMAAVQLQWARISKGKEALAFGYIWADVEGMGMHAFIWHMDQLGVIRFYEPQSGKRVEYKLLSTGLVES